MVNLLTSSTSGRFEVGVTRPKLNIGSKGNSPGGGKAAIVVAATLGSVGRPINPVKVAAWAIPTSKERPSGNSGVSNPRGRV